MNYIDEVTITGKRILLRVDLNVSLNPRHQIGNDERIRQALPTITYLLKQKNSLILLSHLGRPKEHEKNLSLAPVAKRLQEYLPAYKVQLIDDLTFQTMKILRSPAPRQLFVLENIRFFKGEEDNTPEFAKELASLADVYVNDAFSVSHRSSASIVGLPPLLPSYGGLLMKKEVETIKKAIHHCEKPLVAILGGAKVSSKITLIEKLLTYADTVLLGGGLANTFLAAQGNSIGKSLSEPKEIKKAKELLEFAQEKKTTLLLPTDVIVGDRSGENALAKSVSQITASDCIYDIGPQTQAIYGKSILNARTILWNGPVGLFEIDAYRRGTDFIYYAIAQNSQALSLVGGGETLAALSNKEHLGNITHISTGGGAMLEFIEKGTLPGIQALDDCPHHSL